MNGIIICKDSIDGLKAVTGYKPLALLELCGKTLLERTLEKLIAVGANKAYIVCEKDSERIKRFLAHYDNKDRISISFVKAASELAALAENVVIVCDAAEFAVTDLPELSELISGEKDETAFLSSDGRFIAAKLAKSGLSEYMGADEKDALSELNCILSKLDKHYCGSGSLDSVSSLLRCQYDIMNKNKDSVASRTDSNFNGVTIIPPVFIGRNVSVGPGAIIAKGTVIGDNARIASGSEIVGSYIGQNAVIGRHCMVKSAYVCADAVLMNRVRLSKYAVVADKTCVRPNTFISENCAASENDSRYKDSVFIRGEKPIEFDDDCICSLFDSTNDPSAYVRFGKAIASAVPSGSVIAVGRSSDVGTKVLSDALICGVCSSGVSVLDVGICTACQLGFAANRANHAVGVYVGVDANGDLRLIQGNGLAIMSKTEQEICDRYTLSEFRSASIADFGTAASAESEKAAYLRYLEDMLPASLRGICVTVRSNDKAVEALADCLFKRRNDINGKRIVFQLSQDAMTMNAFSEQTGNVRWEQLCLLGCKIMLENNRSVSLPYSVPMTAEKLAQKSQGSVLRYCSVNVDSSDAKAREIAFQPVSAFVRDALMLCSLISAYLSEKQTDLASVLDEIGDICCTQRFINGFAQGVFELENARAAGEEGVCVSDQHTTAFVRPSKNCRSLMIFAESTNGEFASAFCDEISEKLRKYESFKSKSRFHNNDSK